MCSLCISFFFKNVGAGWGGCTVSLVAEDAVSTFIEKMRQTYPPYQELSEDKLREVIFATKPSSGACGEFTTRVYWSFYVFALTISFIAQSSS